MSNNTKLFQKLGVLTALETAELVGISRATLYRWEGTPDVNFPPRVRVGNRTGWKKDAIVEWISGMGLAEVSS